jgi:hypothetical protein
MALLHGPRTLEESLRRDCEELREIRRTVWVEERGFTCVVGRTERFQLARHDCTPLLEIRTRRECGSAVGSGILEVQLVRELVQHEVLAI